MRPNSHPTDTVHRMAQLEFLLFSPWDSADAIHILLSSGSLIIFCPSASGVSFRGEQVDAQSTVAGGCKKTRLVEPPP